MRFAMDTIIDNVLICAALFIIVEVVICVLLLQKGGKEYWGALGLSKMKFWLISFQALASVCVIGGCLYSIFIAPRE